MVEDATEPRGFDLVRVGSFRRCLSQRRQRREIERGIRKLATRIGEENRDHRSWLELTLIDYGKRVLPLTLPIMRRWGQLSSDLGNNNPDLLFAATALEHDLTVATRNVRHFEPTGVKLLNPYEA